MRERVIGLIIFFLFLSCIRIDDPYPDNPGDNDNILDSDILAWITSPQKNKLFQQYNSKIDFGNVVNQDPVISVDTTVRYQTIDGFGNCLTGGSAILLNRMTPESRTRLLSELFSPDSTYIGISYLRISIGASDLSDRVFSYDDLAVGETDPDMLNFSIEAEKEDLIPVLKEILEINPSIMILGSPWSAPVWMKTNNASKGGSLKREYFDAYAKYFVKYVKAMKSEGITIDAITIQNEPLHPGNNPSMYMSPEDQRDFIKFSLGPAFSAEEITTKIIIYDHNCDQPGYPLSILSDTATSKYVDGSAFHLYAGTINALSWVHDTYPDKNLYFTEQWVGAPGNLAGDLKWHVENLIIGATRNWSRNVLEWNLASDSNYYPHTAGGCDQCLGTVTLSGNTVKRNPAYYILAHAAKFVRPGSVRVDSNMPANLPNVAFITPDGHKVLIVVNNSTESKGFNISFKGKTAMVILDAGAVGTYIW